MRKTLTLTIGVILALSSVAAIIRYTDKPNSIPVGSDFFSLQRNSDYINASVNQHSNMLFTSPFFTGNPQFTGIIYGNGSGLSNVSVAVYFAATNGIGQNPTFYGGGNFFGVYHFDEVDATSFYPTNIFYNLTNYAFLGTDGNGQLKYQANGVTLTNLGYSLNTNNVGGGNFVFSGPGSGAILYDTNITTATTLKLFDITACGAVAGAIKIYASCSGGTDRILTFPAGCSGAGLGTPPAVTITNAKAAFFDVIYKPGATPVTNVFWSPVY